MNKQKSSGMEKINTSNCALSSRACRCDCDNFPNPRLEIRWASWTSNANVKAQGFADRLLMEDLDELRVQHIEHDYRDF